MWRDRESAKCVMLDLIGKSSWSGHGGSGLCGLAKAMWAPGLPTRDMNYARKMPNRVLIDIF